MDWLTQPLSEQYIYALDATLGEIVLAISLVYFGFELIRYAWIKRLNWKLIGDSAANACTFIAYPWVSYFIGIYLFYELYYFAYANYSITQIPINPLWAGVCILACDFIYYWEHRFSHRTALGWLTHTVHHSSPEFNISVAYRFGPLDDLYAALLHFPLAFIGFHPALIFAAELFILQYQTLLHTETIPKLPRPIESVFNTPSHHRVHHGSNTQYHDKNYGGMLIIWDRLFGTFAEEMEPVRYGITRPINSVNPFVVFFHGFPRLWNELKRASTAAAALRLLFRPPGAAKRLN